MIPAEEDQLAREVISDMAQPLVEAGDTNPTDTLLLGLCKMCLRAGLIKREGAKN